MLTAGLASLLFKLAKQPVVLGYIVAGMMVGPHMLGEAWVSDDQGVDTWGNIGVLFLLFSLGLEFSFKKLLQVGSTAIVGALTIVVGMMTFGIIAATLMGWNGMNALFLGGMLCMSSTTIVFKAIDDAGLRSHRFAKVAFGILVVEDLFAVVLMVLLSSIAVKNSFEGEELLVQVGKLAAYLAVWFVGGIALIPSFLRRFRKHMNNETMTIFSIGMCLGMVLLALGAGFSSALGAFVMGSILAETIEAERIEHLVEPFKNVFGAMFFVSVGMMIDPELLAQYWLPILIITCIVIVGQIVFGTLGTLLAGQPLRVSLQTSFSLVQIGEFAFIIASLGQSLGVTDTKLYPIVVAVSVITTFLTPYIMKLAYPVLDFCNAHLSDETKKRMDSYVLMRNTPSQHTTFMTKLLSNVKTSLLFLLSFVPGLKRFHKHFLSNLYAREKFAQEHRSLNKDVESVLLSLDIHVGEIDITNDSMVVGRKLKELDIRNNSGVSIVRIVRGGVFINIPGGDHCLYGGDRVVVAGTDKQISDFNALVANTSIQQQNEKTHHQIILDHVTLDRTSKCVGKKLQHSGIREKHACIVMGIIQNEKNIIMNPHPQTVLQVGDTLILAGEKDKIIDFKNV